MSTVFQRNVWLFATPVTSLNLGVNLDESAEIHIHLF